MVNRGNCALALACVVIVSAGCATSRERSVDASPTPVDALAGSCPARGAAFTFVPAGSFSVGGRLEWLSMSGDGETVYALVRAGETAFSVLRIEPAGRRVDVIATHDGLNGDLTVDGGVLRVVLQDTASTLHFFEGSVAGLPEVGVMPSPSLAFGGESFRWNGDTLVAALRVGDGYTLWVGPLAPAAAAPWHERWPANDVAIAVERGTGRTHVVARSTGLRDLIFDRSGALVSETLLDEAYLDGGGYTIAWVEDATGEPLVVAGYLVGTPTGSTFVQRFTADGRLGTGVAFPGRTLGARMTAGVPRGVTTGYGVASLVADTGGIAFHGRADETASEVLELDAACANPNASVASAAGACGYLVACGRRDSVQLFLAVPPAR